MERPAWWGASIACALSLAACTANPDGGGTGVAAADSETQTEPEPEPETTGDEPTNESGDTMDDKLDLPTQDGTPGCQKIDFLFVVDNSESMKDEQERLIDGFPGFMEGVRETIEEFDHHVMVITTDAQDMSFDPCENTLGAGRVRGADGQDCGLLADFLNGERFLDASHEELEEAFACLADVGTDGGGDEKTILAMADAISKEAGTGACNEGFLRDDAILVVTIITDEEDSPDDEPPGSDYDDNSPGDPPAWRQGLIDVKHGDDEAVVVLALVGDSDLEDAMCPPYVHQIGDGAEPGLRIRELAESLPYGSWASVCQENYTDYFKQAIDDIDQACAGFNPVG
ncbi:MAG: hypothetical protein AAF721_03105 [Myxococcota bacterium]